MPTEQASDRPRFDPDPAIVIEDPLLRGVVARSLALATTASFAGVPEVHEPILASDMASLVRLDAAGLGITVLAGLEAAINLRALSLGRNPIQDFSPLVPRRDSGDLVGLLSLETLTLDFMPGVTDAPQADSGVRLAETGPVGEPVPANLANADGAVAFAKDVLAGGSYTEHQIVHLNDGSYGNSHSWIGQTDGTFAGVNLSGSHAIGRIAFGRDNLGTYTDRNAGTYTLQYTTVADPSASTPDVDWVTIDELAYDGEFPDSPYLRHVYEFDPVDATGVRIIVSDGGYQGGMAIDELEVFAPTRSAIEEIGEVGALHHLSLDGTRIIQPSPIVGADAQRTGLALLTELSWLSIDATDAWLPAGPASRRERFGRSDAP